KKETHTQAHKEKQGNTHTHTQACTEEHTHINTHTQRHNVCTHTGADWPSGIPGESPVGRRGWDGPKYRPTPITNRPYPFKLCYIIQLLRHVDNEKVGYFKVEPHHVCLSRLLDATFFHSFPPVTSYSSYVGRGEILYVLLSLLS